MKTLNLNEALALPHEQRKRWCLLGTDMRTGRMTYCCSACFLFRLTRVIAGPLPDKCPRCGTRQVLP